MRSDAAIHRSIVTGLWAQVALRQERNLYRLAGDRQAMVFPGSSLFARTTESKPVRGAKPPAARAPAAVHQPQWLMAGEIVETSRLFMRTVAEVDPQWILELAGHLCRRSHTEPHWDAEAGRVLVRERVLLNGLEVINHLVPYSQVDPTAATEIFIRSALVEEGLRDVFRAPAPIEEQFASSSRGQPMDSVDSRVDSRIHHLNRSWLVSGTPSALIAGCSRWFAVEDVPRRIRTAIFFIDRVVSRAQPHRHRPLPGIRLITQNLARGYSTPSFRGVAHKTLLIGCGKGLKHKSMVLTLFTDGICGSSRLRY